jgi:hypothetical protein
VHEVTDEFLLAVAQIAATLIGLLLLGGFFYLETGLSRAKTVGPAGERVLRATVKLTLVLYTLVLVLALGLVVLRPGWSLAAFVLVALWLVRAELEWTARYRELRAVVPIPRESTWLVWGVTAVVLAVPWVTGDPVPGREAMTWSLLLAGGLALQSTAGLLLTTFDLTRLEEAAQERGRSPGR